MVTAIEREYGENLAEHKAAVKAAALRYAEACAQADISIVRRGEAYSIFIGIVEDYAKFRRAHAQTDGSEECWCAGAPDSPERDAHMLAIAQGG